MTHNQMPPVKNTSRCCDNGSNLLLQQQGKMLLGLWVMSWQLPFMPYIEQFQLHFKPHQENLDLLVTDFMFYM